MASSAMVNLNESRVPSVISAAVTSMALCMIFYVLRIVSRLCSKTPILASDYVLFGGVIACFVISAVDLYVIRLGLGRHVEVVAATDPSLSKIKTMLKFLMLNNCIYAFGQVTVKISLLLLYRHLFPSKRLHLLIRITGWFMIAWGIAFVGVAIFSCNPVYAFWEFELQAQSYCINDQAWYIAMAVPTILTDILILCMPIHQVWKLQLDRRSKVALTFIFLLGSFVCVISVVRVTALFQINNADPSYTLVGIGDWSSVEFAMAVISASLPTLRPLVHRLRPNFWQTRSDEEASDRRSPSRKLWGSHKLGDEFERLPAVGNESFAMHYVPGKVDVADAGPYGDRSIVVTNTFSTGRPS